MGQVSHPSPRSATEFISCWQGAAVTERSGAQSHFIDLCDTLGQPRPVAAMASASSSALNKRIRADDTYNLGVCSGSIVVAGIGRVESVTLAECLKASDQAHPGELHTAYLLQLGQHGRRQVIQEDLLQDADAAQLFGVVGPLLACGAELLR